MPNPSTLAMEEEEAAALRELAEAEIKAATQPPGAELLPGASATKEEFEEALAASGFVTMKPGEAFESAPFKIAPPPGATLDFAATPAPEMIEVLPIHHRDLMALTVLMQQSLDDLQDPDDYAVVAGMVRACRVAVKVFESLGVTSEIEVAK